MGRALQIRDDLSAAELRLRARREKDGRAAARMIAIANALEGMSRAEAARLAGMERQALRDAVVNACCEAWRALLAETGRIRSICNAPWATVRT